MKTWSGLISSPSFHSSLSSPSFSPSTFLGMCPERRTALAFWSVTSPSPKKSFRVTYLEWTRPGPVWAGQSTSTRARIKGSATLRSGHITKGKKEGKEQEHIILQHASTPVSPLVLNWSSRTFFRCFKASPTSKRTNGPGKNLHHTQQFENLMKRF